MKKYLIALALVGAIGLAGLSIADARGNYGYGYCDGYGYCNNWSNTDQNNEKADLFFEETKETRKQIVVKRSELGAMMNQDNPDEKKVAKLTGEIYDLQTFMDNKAKEVFGDNPRYSYGRGRGGYGNCGRGPRNW